MAGTNKTIHFHTTAKPIIILDKPQLPDNVGMVMRAMWNCGFSRLRLIKPRFDYEQHIAKISACSCGAIANVDTSIFSEFSQSITGIERVIATTARSRDLNKPSMTMPQIASLNDKDAIIFGCEKSGLENNIVSYCDAILSIPLNPSFSSLNLAQAVLLTCFQYNQDYQNRAKSAHQIANKADMIFFFDRLENSLMAKGFFKTAEKKPVTMDNLRTMITRMAPNHQELQTLHGIITALLRT
jgi:tRNA/rRNA methyltransferase